MGQGSFRQQRSVQALIGALFSLLALLGLLWLITFGGCCKTPVAQPVYIETACTLPPHPVLRPVEGEFRAVSENEIVVTKAQLLAMAAQNDALKQWVSEVWRRCRRPLDGGVTDASD